MRDFLYFGAMNREQETPFPKKFIRPDATDAEKAELDAQWKIALEIMAENRDMLAKLAKL